MPIGSPCLPRLFLVWRTSKWRHYTTLKIILEMKFNVLKSSTGSGMLGSWWFGGGPSSPDSNYLRVANAAFPNRRLSDNTLMTPKIRIAPSCASSPGRVSTSIDFSRNAKEIFSLWKVERREEGCLFVDIRA